MTRWMWMPFACVGLFGLSQALPVTQARALEGLNSDRSPRRGGPENVGDTGLYRLSSVGSGALIISEVLYDPEAVDEDVAPPSDGEWIELFNPGPDDIDIQGYTLSNAAGEVMTFGDPLLIASGSYLLLASDSDLGDPSVGVTADFVWPAAFTLDNTADTLSLMDGGAALLSIVDYDEANGWPEAVGASIQLPPTLLDERYVETAEAWCQGIGSIGGASTDEGTPGASGPGCPDIDQDADGYFTAEEDCDDLEPFTNIDAQETPDDGIDSDCDGIEIYSIISDPDDDSSFSPTNELSNAYIGWDEDNLVFVWDFTIESNGLIWYLDLGFEGGETDFNSTRGYGGAFPAEIVHEQSIEAMFAFYGAGDPGVYSVFDGSSSDISGQALTLTRTTSLADGTPGQAKVLIPWSALYGTDPGTVPTGTSLNILGAIRGQNDNDAMGDLAPDNASSPVDSYRAIVIDRDGDGVADSGEFDDSDFDGLTPDQGDCDDSNPDTYPGAPESCNGEDNDCDTTVDEEAIDGETFYPDVDEDGFRADTDEVVACEAPEGTLPESAEVDCDDTDDQVFPDAEEFCDEIDNDCDFNTDEDASDATTYYEDADSDGQGNPDSTIEACEEPGGYVLDSNDCDDTRDDVNPGAAEVCDGVDNNCDEEIDEPEAVDAETFFEDSDGDDFGNPDESIVACDAPANFVSDDQDCDDTNEAINPDGQETCDGEDNDCNGEIDDGADDAQTYYPDADGDGARSDSDEETICTPPDGYISEDADIDCDDGDGNNYPGNPEFCDGQDNDCDADADESGALDAQTYFEDNDGDGFGNDEVSELACEAPSGYVSEAGDCNDSDGADDIFPDRPEDCDGRDNDCDEAIDEDFDEDGDGTIDCVDDDGDGQTEDEGDCDDLNDAVFDGNDEICDEQDNDCDVIVDEGVQTTFYQDADDDGFGDPTTPQDACDVPDNYVDDDQDCNDNDDQINPDADEVCDDQDNNCDGNSDEPNASDATTWYGDDDDDGYGDPGTTRDSCKQPTNFVENNDDCDDSDGTLNPETFWYLDGDSDDFGSDDRSTQSCEAPAFSVRSGGDCDDFNPTIYPGADEVCDSLDNNCDGDTDEGFDGDGDGVTICADDCDDSDPDIYPGAPLLCDGKDNDCDDGGDFEEGFDADGDGFLDGDLCADGDDCDDSAVDVFPGADEFCDGIDSNCDGEGDRVTFDVDNDGHLDAFEGCPAGGVGGKPADDCNDDDDEVHPGATLLCDQKDNDCDGAGDIEEGFDQDGDGRLDDQVCDHGDDCDDDDPLTYTGAGEVCELDGDPVDNDCDGTVDDQFDDTDGDGLSACPSPGQEPDCNDNDPNVYPGAPEICDLKDSDCDGTIPANEADVDRDGFPLCSLGGTEPVDCDDSSASAFPGNPAEVCDEADNDCDGDVDEDVQQSFYLDSDEDGTGDPEVSVLACAAPDGYVRNSNDCDDADGTAYLGNVEVCDDIDNDCDGATDERFDADSIGGPDCSDFDGDGFSEDEGDCNDASDTVFPDAEEDPGGTGIGDIQDNDCDGLVDEGTLRFDDDGDGYCELVGDGTCEGGALVGDCNDDDENISPFNSELPNNEVDENCDGTVEDVDGDGFCATDSAVCTGTRDPGDCNDEDADINPSAEDIPGNDVDENCDDVIYDFDGDGVGIEEGDCDDTDANRSPDLPEISGNDFDENCDDVAEDVDGDGFCVEGADICTEDRLGGDCNDGDGAISPGADEIPSNAIDENCDGAVEDVDGDGYCAEGDDICTGDREPGDCDDSDGDTNPGAEDLGGDALDQDCDGVPYDMDGDTYGVDEGDCDDEDAGRNPGEEEIPYDGIDQDCEDGDLTDVDGDGYSSSEAGGSDCDDSNGDINPEAEDTPGDPIDQNCDGDAFDLDGDGADGDDETGEGQDCDDNDPLIGPDMLEACGNTIDENCDGETQLTCDNEDLDEDGQSPDDGDCNDDDPEVFAGAAEVCGDGIDNNCNQVSDEGCTEAGFFTVCDSSGSAGDRGSLLGLLALMLPLMGARFRRLSFGTKGD